MTGATVLAVGIVTPVVASQQADNDSGFDLVSANGAKWPGGGAAAALVEHGDDLLGPASSLLVDNGPLVTTKDGGCNNSDVSELQDNNMNAESMGYACHEEYGYHLADDFSLDDHCELHTITLYAFQPDSDANQSPISSVRLRIWDGPPNEAESTIIYDGWEGMTLLENTFSDIYRARRSNPGSCENPIMKLVLDMKDEAIKRGDGYWLEYMIDGSRNLAGPYTPPVTEAGTPGSGNALMYDGFEGVWVECYDQGGDWYDDMPFQIHGDHLSVYLSSSGTCPGLFEFNALTDVPFSQVAFIYGLRSGSAGPVPGCTGLYVDILQPTLIDVVSADGSGMATLRGTVPPAACGRVRVQAIDLTNCGTSNVIITN
ncbi:MAG: hypothetical protein D8M59_14760 [Planctomycetes bacterium]|nr:hypothetical protein [Planctomycetota bacterium]